MMPRLGVRTVQHVNPTEENTMHAQVVTFGLKDITEDQFLGVAAGDAPAFVAMPGLLAKVWLRDPETNTYGGLYVWADQEAYEGYIKGEVFKSIKENPHLQNVESRDYGVFDDLSAVTAPQLRAV
jgi:quinol monooxygenase YgiN